MVLMTTLVSMLLYLDRFCISFAEIFIKEDLGLSDTQIGWILSAFFWTYALAQVPSGWLSDRFGVRLMLTIYIFGWSVLTGLTGLAMSFVMLLVIRLGFGLAQAGAYPSSANLISKWVPFAARGTASATIAVGGRIGGALAPLVTAYLIVAFVPLSVPSKLTPSDLLDPGRFFYELAQPGQSPSSSKTPPNEAARRIGSQILANLSDQTRENVQRVAEVFFTSEGEDQSSIEAGDDLLPLDSRPPPHVTEEESGRLIEELNLLLGQTDWYEADDFFNVPLGNEARRLLAITKRELTLDEKRRLGRLLMEAVYPASIKKVHGHGWRAVMFLYGFVGVLIAAFYWWCVRDRPDKHPRCNSEERALIRRGRPGDMPPPVGVVGAVPLAQLLRSRSMWLICLSQWATNVGWVFLVTWLPRYLVEVHDVPLERRAWMVFIPAAVGWFGTIAGGRLTDRLVHGVGLRWARALPLFFSRLTAMAAYLCCLFDPGPWTAVVAFSVVAFSTDLGTGSVWAFNQDVGGRYAGSVLGWGNMWGNLGAAITPPLLIGIIGPAHNWNAAFLTCAAAFFIAGVAVLGVDATIPIVPLDEPDDSHSGDE